jgi:glycosyltransferase involved in cell wall biosynthesis
MTEAPIAAMDLSSNADRRLRIIGVDPERGFAGGESQVLGLTLELLGLGHDAELMCDPEGTLWRRARSENVVCHPLRIRNAVDLRAGLGLRRFLSRNHFDVVHFHTSRAHSMAPFAAGLAGALIVTRRMDYVPNRLFSAYLYNRAVDAVAAISQEVADALGAAGVSRDRITIIPSGVDCRRFAPPSPEQRAAARTRLGLGADEITVGAVGGLELRKGHRYLLEALGHLRGTLPAVRCFIAGSGSQREVLQEQVRRLDLESAVRLIGSVEDPRALFWAIDIFVQPSIKEGLGVALLEAMACGLPAIASRAGGMAEVIEDRHNGRLVMVADASTLSQALKELIQSPARRAAIGTAARTRVAMNFSMETMASRTLALYQSSLGGC